MANEGAVPAGWYPQPDGGFRYWDGSAWSEARRASRPRTPWTSWVAVALLVVGPVTTLALPQPVLEALGVPSRLVGVVVPASWVLGILAIVLAAVDVFRGRGRRFPREAAITVLVVSAVPMLLLATYAVAA